MMTPEQKERYARHIMLHDVGEDGQQRLQSARVLIIGAGGLGSPAAFYLAAAGVGTIGIADHDLVELSNLQRQIIHRTGDIGRAKVDSAQAGMLALNPDVTVTTYRLRVDTDSIGGIVAGYDFILDCTDNFSAKFLINDGCVAMGKPYSHGGILRFNGQTMTVIPGESPCYRCIFPEPPDEGTSLACSRDGVIGVLPGVIGTIQATEAIKHILAIGDLLLGRLLTYDSLRMKFREIPVRRNPGCPACAPVSPP